MSPRNWSTRPLTLAIGWIMSCALVTAVTLTAVNRVGHEVAGSTPRVVSQAGVSAQLSQNSASAAANPASPPPSPVESPSVGTEPATPGPTPSHSKPVATTTGKPSHHSPTPVTSPSPDTSNTPPPASSPASPIPPASSSPPSTVASSSPSASPSPSASVSTGKSVFVVPGAQIVIACSGDSIANASVQLTDSTYKFKPKSMTDPSVDVVITNNSSSNEYIYTCLNGKASPQVTERPGMH